MKFAPLTLFFLLLFSCLTALAQKPLKVAVIGLTHTHVHWILGSDQEDIEIVAIVESNKDLAQRYTTEHGLSMDLVFESSDEMLAVVTPEAVTAFGSIYEHLAVVEKFAPLGIHVMVEKPLAVSMEHANKMFDLAKKYNIQLLTNYETTWYPTNEKVHQILESGKIGSLRKIVAHDGHQGPIEIGVNQEFLDWLTDPVLNGGGAITDFGCYGANLITWLVQGQKPMNVMAMTQTIKPDLYPKVDDEATILLQYPTLQGVIQASWNWPVSRKDLEVYGKTGYAISENHSNLTYRENENTEETTETLDERHYPFNDPFSLFAAVIRNEVTLPRFDPSSLENNMIVMEILEAAKTSANTGQVVPLK